MNANAAPHFDRVGLEELEIDDEPSFRHVGLYADLKEVLVRARYPFRILPARYDGRYDIALLVNLTFWGANEGGDVLHERRIAADVVTHVAWHHLAARALAASPGAPLSSDALFLGESIASAFDIYLVGRLLGHAPASSFLESQVPAMADVAEAAGLSEADLDALLGAVGEAPERAFEELRQLLFDATSSLARCANGDEALGVVASFEGHRFAPLLQRYELSNWVLYARSYGASGPGGDERALAVDRALRAAPDALAWLTSSWVDAALASP